MHTVMFIRNILNLNNQHTREESILNYLGLVKNIVSKLYPKIKTDYSPTDLVSIGTIGLISSVDKYDSSYGATFYTFAQKRIRGAIFDELRSKDNFSRTTRKKQKEVSKLVEKLEHKYCREVSNDEVALELGVPVEHYNTILNNIQPLHNVSISESDDDTPNLVLCSSLNTPDDNIMQDILVNQIKSVIYTLTPRERLVLTLYYYYDIRLKDIGVLLEVSESRISQILLSAISQLQGGLHEQE